ncbi:hypothetical protein SLS56_007350 [Neofusicoccum ribis]|uniref:NmrA-like domain-containing protein n=1 Tax=Neofusicoccum ribis TaxID=45134 RepID=A0ABR3SNW8_9PEZI
MKIAIAGGTSPTLGHAIVSALLRNPHNTPVILSRSATSFDPAAPSSTTTLYGAELRHVDYTDPHSLAAALHDIHTVISVIKQPDPHAMAATQTALLSAAAAAGVKRFAPSEFGVGAAERVDATADKERVWAACRASGLEVARFRCGLFMNYLALGGREFGSAVARERACAGLADAAPVIWDFEAGVAELPVGPDGRAPRVTLTEIDDVGRFVAAACGLTEGTWVEEMGMVGETIGLEDVVQLVRECLGVDLKVKRVARDELERRVASVDGIGRTREEVFRKMIAQIELVMLEEKEGWGIIEPVLNEMCLHTKPLSVREYLQNYR